jgi:hypothetical protein
LGDVYTCHGFLSRTQVLECQFQNISSQVYCMICWQRIWFPLATSYQQNLWNPIDNFMQLWVGEHGCHKI